jgi:hypothetical protein
MLFFLINFLIWSCVVFLLECTFCLVFPAIGIVGTNNVLS